MRAISAWAYKGANKQLDPRSSSEHPRESWTLYETACPLHPDGLQLLDSTTLRRLCGLLLRQRHSSVFCTPPTLQVILLLTVPVPQSPTRFSVFQEMSRLRNLTTRASLVEHTSTKLLGKVIVSCSTVSVTSIPPGKDSSCSATSLSRGRSVFSSSSLP